MKCTAISASFWSYSAAIDLADAARRSANRPGRSSRVSPPGLPTNWTSWSSASQAAGGPGAAEGAGRLAERPLGLLAGGEVVALGVGQPAERGEQLVEQQGAGPAGGLAPRPRLGGRGQRQDQAAGERPAVVGARR